MPTYMYKAKTLEGKDIRGTLEANDSSAVLSMLKEKGYFPIEVNEQGFLEKDIQFDFGGRIKLKDIAVFCRQFSTIINAGVSVLGALDILRQQTGNKKLRGVIEKVYGSVQKGNTLSNSMREHNAFPSILLNMVEAGEVSGSLDVALDRMAVHFEKENRLNQKIKTAMTYPIIISIIAIFVIGILITFVVPTFVSMFAQAGAELPSTTKILMSFSDMIKNFWYIILIIAIVMIVLFRFYASTDVGRKTIDTIKLYIPILGTLNKKIISSRFTRTLSTLLASGLPLLTALEVVAKVVDNYIVAKGLERARQEVSRGISLAQPIAQIGVFPPMVTYMLRIGEDTGTLESVLNKTADFYDDEVEAEIARMTTLLEPLIICVMAVVVGFVVISIMQPIFGMYRNISTM